MLRSEPAATYAVGNDDDATIAKALQILAARLRQPGVAMGSPQMVRDYLQLQMAELEHEEFVVLFLDSQNCLIANETLARGTINQTSVYSREVVKSALKHNASSLILAHNHPSGVAEPSNADRTLTAQLKTALALIDVRVLDHFIVAGNSQPLSMAERGLM